MDKFKINTENFCNAWKLDKECQDRIGKFLLRIGRGRSIEDHYMDFLQRNDSKETLRALLPDIDRWENDGYKTGPLQHEMIRQLKTFPDLENDKINWYHFPYYEGFNFYPGVILNQDFQLNYDDLSHQEIFRYMFATIFNQSPNADKFLNFHLVNSFNNEVKKYTLFLHSVAKDNKSLIESGIKLWDLWIEDNLKSEKTFSTISPEKSDKAKEINLIEDYVPRITKALQGFFPSENNEELIRLLKGEKINGKLVFTGNAKRLVEACFKRLSKVQLITDPPEKLIDWLITNFQYTSNKKPKDLEVTTVAKYLTGENDASKPIAEIEKIAKEYKDSIPKSF